MTTGTDTSTITLPSGPTRSQLQGSRTEFPCAVGRHLHAKTNWSKERFEQWRMDTFKGSCANSPFYNGTLHPSWFINVDGVRTLNFSDVKWCGVSREPGDRLDRDIEILTSALNKVKALGKNTKMHKGFWNTFRSVVRHRTRNLISVVTP